MEIVWSGHTCCIDSDRQCDPADFAKLVALRGVGNMVMGRRNRRSDVAIRTTAPVHHRVRTAGTAQVYKPTTGPQIGYEHLQGLRKLHGELSDVG